MIRDDQPDAREGQAGRGGVTERLVVPLKPVMPVEGRGLGSRQTHDAVRDLEIGQPINLISVQKLQRALHAKAKAEAGYRFYALCTTRFTEKTF